MAGIDKIYMTEREGREFWNWILDHEAACEKLTGGHSLSYSMAKTNHGYVVNYPEVVDWYLWEYCNLRFIRERLAQQYAIRPENKFENTIAKLHELFPNADTDTIIKFVEAVTEYEPDIIIRLLEQKTESGVHVDLSGETYKGSGW